jgi:capsular polysaccharide biosynthesis protein
LNPSEYLKILLRRGWIILLGAVLVGASAFGFSRVQTPVYRATQQILVKPARNDWGLNQALVSLLNSYKAWMETKTLAQRVITYDEKRPQDLDPDQLRGMVTISITRESNLITVDVDMRDGEQAKIIARSYGELFQQWRERENAPLPLQDRINVELLDYPNYGQIRPSTTTNVLAGVVLGILLGGVVVFILETISAQIIRRGADVEFTLSLPVLGAIPEGDAA